MPDSLDIFGQRYTGVTGIKVTDTGGNTLTYIRPQGTLSVTTNGTKDVTQYSSIDVNVGGSAPIYQTKTVSPTESQQVIEPDSNYDALSSVTVNAISSTYVGTGVTRKSAATITPGTTNQTIASGTYLTGTQTIAGDADLVAGNIKAGVQIFGVTGNLSFITYYTGSSTPSSSLGSDGDIYLKVS